jgi:hypothetical protein
LSFTPDPILGAEKLTAHYDGRWPTFHDAEIIELRLDRGNFMAGMSNPDLMAAHLILTVQTCEEAPGTRPALVTLRFDGVEDLELSGFNYQNAIYGLVIGLSKGETGEGDGFCVRIDPAFGLGATFHCAGIEVVEAVD